MPKAIRPLKKVSSPGKREKIWNGDWRVISFNTDGVGGMAVSLAYRRPGWHGRAGGLPAEGLGAWV